MPINFFTKKPPGPEKNKHGILETMYLTLSTGMDVPWESVEFVLPKLESEQSFWDEFAAMQSDKSLKNEQKLQFLNVRLGNEKSGKVLIQYQEFINVPQCEDNIQSFKMIVEESERILNELREEGEKIDTAEMLKIWKSKFPARIVEAMVIKFEGNATFEALREEMKRTVKEMEASKELEVTKVIEYNLKQCKLYSSSHLHGLDVGKEE